MPDRAFCLQGSTSCVYILFLYGVGAEGVIWWVECGREGERNQLIKNYFIWPSPGFCGCSKRKSSAFSSANMEEIQPLHSFGSKIPLAMS